MVQCGCGKVLDKVPAWLGAVSVEFVCTNCPKRQVKKITQVQLDTTERTSSEVPALDNLEAEDAEELDND